MSPFAYYSPMLVGVVLIFSMSGAIRESYPTYSDAAWYAMLTYLALRTAVHCQFIMIGLQGVYAQVLPVPMGKSIRGGAAVAAGSLILISALGFAAWALLISEWMVIGATIAAIIATGSGLGAAVVYVWNIPAAVRDFADER